MTSTWSTNTKKNETEFINYLFHIVASFIEKKRNIIVFQIRIAGDNGAFNSSSSLITTQSVQQFLYFLSAH